MTLTNLVAADKCAEVRVEKKALLQPKAIQLVKDVSEGSRLRYFNPSRIFVKQERLLPAKGLVEVRPDVPFHILVTN